MYNIHCILNNSNNVIKWALKLMVNLYCAEVKLRDNVLEGYSLNKQNYQ